MDLIRLNQRYIPLVVWVAEKHSVRGRLNCVRFVFALCSVCVRFVFGLCSVCVRFVFGLCSVCVRFVFGLCSGFSAQYWHFVRFIGCCTVICCLDCNEGSLLEILELCSVCVRFVFGLCPVCVRFSCVILAKSCRGIRCALEPKKQRKKPCYAIL